MGITKYIAYKFANYRDLNSFGSKRRKKRIKYFMKIVERVYNEKGSIRIIDVGGTFLYWRIVDREFFRKYNMRITVVNLEENDFRDENFEFVCADGRDLNMFKDKEFDIAHSNSVIEHVGDFLSMKKFADEIRRVARFYFVQTPSFWFPLEPHSMFPFFHWFPEKARIKLVMKYQLGNWRKAEKEEDAVEIVRSANLLKKRDLKALFPCSKIIVERFFFLPKSYIAIKDA